MGKVKYNECFSVKYTQFELILTPYRQSILNIGFERNQDAPIIVQKNCSILS